MHTITLLIYKAPQPQKASSIDLFRCSVLKISIKTFIFHDMQSYSDTAEVIHIRAYNKIILSCYVEDNITKKGNRVTFTKA